jgi:hypothetical protein
LFNFQETHPLAKEERKDKAAFEKRKNSYILDLENSREYFPCCTLSAQHFHGHNRENGLLRLSITAAQKRTTYSHQVSEKSNLVPK